MSESAPLTTGEKALALNLDPTIYGTFAEIGAGQETANCFFRASATAGTVAKAMSAYDMTMSDSIYGSCKRYVSRERLIQMLAHEYEILVERLSPSRGADTTFFVFANTVRAKPYMGRGEFHGWLGIRLQLAPLSDPHDIFIHVRLLDESNLDQMEALGVVGVNLIYAAFLFRDDLKKLAESLLDDLGRSRVEVDMLKFSGPGFAHIDNRLCSLQLVESSLTDAALFGHDGEVMQPAERFYRKAILLIRGSFSPVTRTNLDMLDAARKKFEPLLENPADYVEVMECTMENLLTDGSLDKEEFLHRSDVMQSLGKTVLVSRFAEFHRLSSYLSRYTSEPLGIVLGVGLLEEIFDEKWYENLQGGILEAFGRLFKNQVKLYAYPVLDGEKVITATEARIATHLYCLYRYLLENRFIEAVEPSDRELLRFSPGDVRRMRESGDSQWKALVPAEVMSFYV